MIQWFSPHEIEKLRLEREVDALIFRDYEAYHRIRKVDKKSYPPQVRHKKKKKRGVKSGIKRGPYKKRNRPSQLSSSKYYANGTEPAVNN